MKRMVLVLSFVLALPFVATAQSPENSGNVSLDFVDAPRADILRALVTGIVFDDPVPGSWSGNLTNVPMAEAIEAVLPKEYEVVNRGSVIHIRKTATQTVSNNVTAPAEDEYVSPNSSNPWGRAEWMRTVGYPRMREEAAIAQMQTADLEYRASIQSQGNYGYQRGYGRGNSGAYTGYSPWMVGCSDGRPSSYLEFKYKGARGERELWFVSINGITPGTVDQGDSYWNKIPICSDAAVTVTVEKIGESHKWERQYSLRPFTSTEVPVGEFLFKDIPRLK